MKRLRGLKSLVQAAVEHGSRAVERAQIETAKLPFDLVAKVPGLQVPANGVREIYNTGVSGVHTMIRLVNKVAGDTLDTVLAAVEPSDPGPPTPAPGPPAPDPGAHPPADGPASPA